MKMKKNLIILQWNVWCYEDIHNVAKLIKHENADIVCLQELTINSIKQNYLNTVDFLKKKLKEYSYCYYEEISFFGETSKLANAIFSKYPIVKSKTLWVNKNEGVTTASNESRCYIESKIKFNNKIITVGTTHLSYVHKLVENEVKLKEAQILLKDITKNKENYIITGDFNALPSSYLIKEIEKIFINLGGNLKNNTWSTNHLII